jgi:CBS domain-containing protein
MKVNVISIRSGSSVRAAVDMIIDQHIGTLPVVDLDNKLIGVVRISDLAALVMPDFVRLLDHFEFVHNFGAFETRMPSKDQLDQAVDKIMQPPFYAEDTASLLHAASILHQKGVIDLPIIDHQGHLVGIASHVDVVTALMLKWTDKFPNNTESEDNR